MTLAVRTLANSEYGALNDEVQKMSQQLSWGVAPERLGTLSHPPQEMRMSCVAKADEDFPFTIKIWEPSTGGGQESLVVG